jgi:hypothetical protein
VARAAFLALTASVALAGCASRLERSRALSAPAPVASRERTRPPRLVAGSTGSEYGRASAMRISLPGAVLRREPQIVPEPQVVYVGVPAYGDGSAYDSGACACGPEGASGTSDSGYAAYVGTYFAPGGAVSPGLRPPTDVAPPHSVPSGAPYAASFAQGDVMDHRPGLSVGSGVFGRRD